MPFPDWPWRDFVKNIVHNTNIYKFTSISFKIYKYIYFYQHAVSRSTMQGFCEEYHSHTSSTFANIFVENKAFKPSSLANRFLQKSKHSQQAVSISTLQWFCEEYRSHTRSTFAEIFEENKAFNTSSLEKKLKHSQHVVSRSTLQWFCEEYYSHTRSNFTDIFEENKAFNRFSLADRFFCRKQITVYHTQNFQGINPPLARLLLSLNHGHKKRHTVDKTSSKRK